MDKRIDGKRYNTETARLLARCRTGESLYVKKTGEYFLCHEEVITPADATQAGDWAKINLSRYDYALLFSGAEEPVPRGIARRQISILLPVGILEALDLKREELRVDRTELIIRALRGAGYGGGNG